MENSEMETQISEDVPTVDGVVAPSVTEAFQEVDISEIVTNIYNDVHVIMVFVILTFAMSCMRAWRRNSLKGV